MNTNVLNIEGKKCVLTSGLSIIAPYKIEKAWYDDNENQIIVLMDYADQKVSQEFRNLVSYSIDNKINWEAELPTSFGVDAYVDASISGNHADAFSFSCFRCLIDLSDGKLLQKSFAK